MPPMRTSGRRSSVTRPAGASRAASRPSMRLKARSGLDCNKQEVEMRSMGCRFSVATTAIMGVLFAAQPTWGWGPGGHMIVAYIAYGRLNDRARGEVDKLIAIK